MKLSRLEIFGFKSFAKKLDLTLHGGITAVVGPNGCGKTNVVDAIRWVLGEQRPTRIRLDAMEDVVFKGSGTRRPLGMAEVSLTIENASGILPANLPEVTITRRFFRSGESEYLINRKQCRLTDINEMFMDTGMGSDSYSVFEQGMINAILSDKTEDRRHIFEEAAGITKYKARRKSAISTLASIDGDLERLGDIVAELERRVAYLKRQAGRASRFRELKAELKGRTLSLGAFEIELQRRRIREASDALASLTSALDDSRTKIQGLDTEIGSLSGELVAVEKELAETAGRYDTAVRAIAEKENELARCESRLEALAELTERSRDASERNRATRDHLAGDHGRRNDELAEVKKALDGINALRAETAEQLRAVDAKVGDAAAVRSRIEREYREQEREVAAGEAALCRIGDRRMEAERRKVDLAEKIERLTVALGEAAEAYTRLEARRHELGGKKQELESRRRGLDAKRAEYAGMLGEMDDQILKLRERQAAFRAEGDFLAEVIASLDGCQESVRQVAGAPELSGRVHGVFADLVTADDRHVAAIEAALADRFQDLVVDTVGDAVAGVAWLMEHTAGRAGFLPLDAGGQGHPSPAIPEDTGVIGRADGFVRAEERFLPAVRRYLADVVVVDTLETAVRLHGRDPGFRYVALDGSLVGRRGAITGGKASADEGQIAIGRAQRLADARAGYAEVSGEIETLERKRNTVREHAGTVDRELQSCGCGQTDCDGELARVDAERARVAAKRESLVEQLGGLREEVSRIDRSFAGLDEDRRKHESRISGARDAAAALREQLSSGEGDLKARTDERDGLRAELNSCEVRGAALREKKAALEREIAGLDERREALARATKRTMAEIEDAEAEHLRSGERIRVLREDIDGLAKGHASLEQRKQELEDRHRRLRAFRAEKESALQELRSRRVELTSRESSLTLERDEATMIMNNVVQRITEEYLINPDEIPPAEIEPGYEPEAERSQLADLRRQIHMIGDVNLEAEEEYNREKGRLDALTGERDDMLAARNDLYETIGRINRIAINRFRETFQLIRENFQKTFADFFDGGVCDLEIEDGADPLEATIRITARPPGKNVRSISLLSSGERALTAISLLFALYLVKPSPFCILDEVDAPLDDANLDRFLRVIKKFSARTQFIMVTHNKKTMAQADNLYGITMQEPGLSSLVSVRLSEVETYPEEPSDGKTAAALGKEH